MELSPFGCPKCLELSSKLAAAIRERDELRAEIEESMCVIDSEPTAELKRELKHAKRDADLMERMLLERTTPFAAGSVFKTANGYRGILSHGCPKTGRIPLTFAATTMRKAKARMEKFRDAFNSRLASKPERDVVFRDTRIPFTTATKRSRDGYWMVQLYIGTYLDTGMGCQKRFGGTTQEVAESKAEEFRVEFNKRFGGLNGSQ